MRRALYSVVWCALLAACAPSIVTSPAALRTTDEPRVRYVLTDGVTGTSTAGYSSTIQSGTVLAKVGSVPQGMVLEPINHVLTVVGDNLSEAYAVVKNGDWVGFYLPVQQTFSPLKSVVPVALERQQ